MTTSGSADYDRTATQIVTRALMIVRAVASGETPTADESASALETLNLMAKAWQAQGIHLWTEDEAIMWVVKGTTEYTLSSTGDHASSSWVRTTLGADAAAGAGTLTVASITGISNADNIGIVLDDGTLQWDTVNGAPSGTTVTLTGTLNSAASSGNQVWAYTTKLVRPLKMLNPRRRNSSVQDIPIWMVSRSEYMGTPNKTAQAPFVNVFFSPQLTAGKVHLWPAPDNVNDTLLFTARRAIEDFDALTNTPDFPAEWLEALSFNLALRLCPEYDVPTNERIWIKSEAEQMKAELLMWDNDGESVFFGPEEQWA